MDVCLEVACLKSLLLQVCLPFFEPSTQRTEEVFMISTEKQIGKHLSKTRQICFFKDGGQPKRLFRKDRFVPFLRQNRTKNKTNLSQNRNKTVLKRDSATGFDFLALRRKKKFLLVFFCYYIVFYGEKLVLQLGFRWGISLQWVTMF